MKSAVYEVIGCIGSQKFCERAEYDTMREAKAEAKRLNNDLNDESKFFAGKAGNDGAPLQR